MSRPVRDPDDLLKNRLSCDKDERSRVTSRIHPPAPARIRFYISAGPYSVDKGGSRLVNCLLWSLNRR